MKYKSNQIHIACSHSYRSPLCGNGFRPSVADRLQGPYYMRRQLRRQQALRQGLPLHLPHGNGHPILLVASHSGHVRGEVAEAADIATRSCN